MTPTDALKLPPIHTNNDRDTNLSSFPPPSPTAKRDGVDPHVLHSSPVASESKLPALHDLEKKMTWYRKSGLTKQTEIENKRMGVILNQINSQIQASQLSSLTSNNGNHRTVLAILDLETHDSVTKNIANLLQLVDLAKTGEPLKLNALGESADDLGHGKRSDRSDREKDRRNDRKSNSAGIPIPSATSSYGYKMEKRQSVGRKSIRTIADELHEKIQSLKNNPSQWEVFCARVGKF
jgi:hypothetical protein